MTLSTSSMSWAIRERGEVVAAAVKVGVASKGR